MKYLFIDLTIIYNKNCFKPQWLIKNVNNCLTFDIKLYHKSDYEYSMNAIIKN